MTIIFSSIAIMTCLNYCELFWWFYYAETKCIVFVWFHLLICLNYFMLLFALIILKIYLIICLESRFLTLFLLTFLFRGFNFARSAINSSGSNFTSPSSSNGTIGGNSSSSKSRVKFSYLFRTLILFCTSSAGLSHWVVYHIILRSLKAYHII